MRICLVWDSDYPWDIRAQKVARSLTEAGHHVDMVARNRRWEAQRESLPECTVHRLAPLRFLGRRLSSLSSFPAFFNPRWVRLIARVATDADVIVCRDIPLAPTSIWVGRQLGIPVVLDMAENYPAMIHDIWENGRQRWSDIIVRNPRAVSRVEKWTLDRVDHVIVVVEESRDRLVGLGVPPDHITVVSNTPSVGKIRNRVSAEDRVTGDPIELIYLGLLEAPRGIAVLIDAVGMCRAANMNVKLTLIGDGRERQDFERQAREIDPDGQVIRFLGYRPNNEALDLLHRAHIGVIPHHAHESWNTTIPNKLFDYMAAGLAVIGSDARPVKRVIEESGCGLVFRDRDTASLASVIQRLGDDELRAQCGKAGQLAISEKFNWDADTRRLLHAIHGAGHIHHERPAEAVAST